MKYRRGQDAWADYEWWRTQDQKVLERIDALLRGRACNGDVRVGKPVPLGHSFQGYWPRRITDAHGLAYRIAGEDVRIAACL